MVTLVLQAGAHGAWEAAWPAWLVAASRHGPLLLAALAALLVLRALARRGRYSAQDALRPEAAQAVRAAIAAAERRSRGEVVVVVLERSDDHPGACWLAALATLLLGTALLVRALPWQRPELVLGAQLALGAAGWLLARALPDLQRLFVREARADQLCHEQAALEFQRAGMARTAGRTGVLLFASLFEQRVVVLGDEAIHAQVDPALWSSATEAVLRGAARGDLAGGLVAGVQACGEVLAARFPREPGDANELPDHLVVRRR